MYFTSNDKSQNILKEMVLIMFLVGNNQREYVIVNLSHYILLSHKTFWI